MATSTQCVVSGRYVDLTLGGGSEEINVVDWTMSKEPILCSWIGESYGRYDFDINKADRIFDMLLQKKQIQLSPDHTVPSAEELKKKTYCKWHNSITHHTNHCKKFRQQIQMAIEQGRIKFDTIRRPMEFEGAQFPVSTGEATPGDGKSKIMFRSLLLTSDQAKRSGAVDPCVQASAANLKYVKRADEIEKDKANEVQSSHEQKNFCLSREEFRMSRKELGTGKKGFCDDSNISDYHWDCPFFRYCWNEKLRLPSANDCPECSGQYSECRKAQFPWPSVHNQSQAQGPACHRLMIKDDAKKIDDPSSCDQVNKSEAQWCPPGLTKTQKRRMQRLRCKGQHQEWRVKQKADEGKSSANVDIISVLPAEFRANYDSGKPRERIAQLVLQPQQAVFDKPEDNKHRRRKPLYVKGYVDGKPMARMLVDNGSSVNLMPYSTYCRLGRLPEDLIETDMILENYKDESSQAKGILSVELTIGNKSLQTAFFVINGEVSYNLLLGREWIHDNCCIPSTMHQMIIQWNGNLVEIVPADESR